jgi:hypothetical protein
MIDYVNYSTRLMIQEKDLKHYYLHFIDFLLQQKRVLIEIGFRF